MLFLIIILAAIIVAVVLNTAFAGSTGGRPVYRPEAAPVEALERLAGAIRIQTVSHYDHDLDELSHFSRFQDYMLECFPRFHEIAERTILSEYAVIYKWQGSSPDRNPVLLTAHYDVVPADEKKWSKPPFAAVSENGFLWGRGTLDTKNNPYGLP